MNELESQYQGKIQFTKIDINTQEGYCEYTKHGFTHIPAMLFIDSKGNIVTQVEEFQDQDQLKQKLDELLKAG